VRNLPGTAVELCGRAGWGLEAIDHHTSDREIHLIFQCRSARHSWLDPQDASKCCNGYVRVLCIANVRGCDKVGHDLLPGGEVYGYRWVKDDGQEQVTR